jgi:hypothetical protein
MKKTNIITLTLSIIAFSLAIYLGNIIFQEQNRFDLIAESEKLIKENLIGLREAQILHKRKYGSYAESWQKLTDFISTDTLMIVDLSETIIPRTYQEDSVIIVIDTVGSVSVSDSLFGHGKYQYLMTKNIKKVPLQTHSFIMEVHNDSTLKTSYLYIGEEQPLDKMRRKPIIRNDKVKRIKGTKPLLTIGSREDESLKSSWTK